MQDIFAVQRNCLRLMGHDLADAKSQRFQKWHTIKHYASLLLVVSAQCPMMYYVIYHIDDLRLATAALSIIFTNVLTVIKISTFLHYKRHFVQLMEQFERMFRALGAAEAKSLLIVDNQNAIKFVNLYYYSVSATGVYFMVGPLVKNIWAQMTDKELIKELPMPMRFPFDFESTPGYQCCYLYTGLVTLTVVLYASAIDGLFVSFTINLRAHFQSLQLFIKNNSFQKAQPVLQHDISNYVQYHQLLLELSNQVRDTYAPIVFGQFLITSLQVCVIIYQLVSSVGALVEMATYCTFLSSILLQLLIYCYGGEVLKIESLMVGTAVQLSNWYNLEPPHRRMLCLLLQRSQREVIIKAGFYEASLANFMIILKAAMSYITLIQSIE